MALNPPRSRRGLAVTICLAAIVALPGLPVSAADTAIGQRAYDAGNFVEALRDWTPLAEAGDRDAAFGLGVLYDLGSGVAPDPVAALRWYRRAAEAGLPPAEFNVGVMYDSGRGVARDGTQAALWYARAASHGHLRAAYNLGQLYTAGDGVPKNLPLAIAWYQKAAAGLAAASSRLVTLRAAAGAPDTVRDSSADALPKPELLAPGDLAVLRYDRTKPDAMPEAELVWTLPAAPAGRSRFFVQVRALGDDSASDVSAGYVDVSALLVRLPARPAHYAWRVYTVQAAPARYSVTEWRQFMVAAADGPSEWSDNHHDDNH